MKELVESVKELKNSDVGKTVEERIRQFENLRKKGNEELFSEMCFCTLTANFNAERAIKIQKALGKGFIELERHELASKLKELGYRYPNTRAGYIDKNKAYCTKLEDLLKSMSENELRDWIAKNIKGLGYKEASHFLRNIGYKNFAIIDFHIIDILVKHGLIERPKHLTRKKYLEIERVLGKISEAAGISQGELDLYLWYMETGKILK